MDAINVIVKLFTRFQSFVADSASQNKLSICGDIITRRCISGCSSLTVGILVCLRGFVLHDRVLKMTWRVVDIDYWRCYSSRFLQPRHL